MQRAMTAPTGQLQVRLLQRAEDFRDIRDAWLELERQSDQPVFFQSFAWCGHVAEVMTVKHPGRYAPLVALATRDGAPVGLWPLSRQKRSGIWQLRPLDDPFGQFAGLLCRDAADAELIIVATLDVVRERRLADCFRAEFVLKGSPLEKALTSCGAKARGDVGAPVIDVRGFPTFEALKASRNKKTMKNLRNATNRLSKAGDHAHHVATTTEDVAKIVEATLQRRTAWLAEKGLTAPQFRSAAHEAIITGGAAWNLDKDRIGFELICGGRPIAQQWGFVHNKRYYAYMSAVDPSAVHLSPGRLHLAFVIADAMRAGVDGIEMLTPASDYKMVWTDTVRTLIAMAMPLSVMGRAHDLIWERTARPALKACFYAMPAGLRRRVVPRDETSDSSDHD
jgi:CelD/BcsL family acetyltransferase involved in cellulose biosynthesis